MPRALYRLWLLKRRLEELNDSVTSLALLNIRFLQEQNAIFSVAVTTTAIFLILIGIYVFTRQISVLSSGLLRPLRLLADDMQHRGLWWFRSERCFHERFTAS